MKIFLLKLKINYQIKLISKQIIIYNIDVKKIYIFENNKNDIYIVWKKYKLNKYDPKNLKLFLNN